ncbi:MAG: adenosylcobinamide-phosphate synthase CbiB [bacterium]
MKLLSIVLAYLLDLIFGDPRWLPHPVRGMGKLAEFLEKKLRNTSALFLRGPQEPSFRLRRQASPESHCRETHLGTGINSHTSRKSVSTEVLAGMIIAIAVVGSVYAGSFFAIRFAEQTNRWAGFALSTLLIFTTLSTRSLGREARSVYRSLKSGNIKEARKKLSFIVGRDTQALNQDEIIRATVETVAENSVDGIISPLLYAALGGAPLALAYKAINTLDSMIGYKNERYLYFGWFSAKLDDVANYIPARLSILLVPLASLILRKRTLSALYTILRDGKKSPSPNAGIPEAGFAGALGIQLGGVNYYQRERISKPILGAQAKQRDKEDIIEAVHLMWVISSIFFGGEVLILWGLSSLL